MLIIMPMATAPEPNLQMLLQRGIGERTGSRFKLKLSEHEWKAMIEVRPAL